MARNNTTVTKLDTIEELFEKLKKTTPWFKEVRDVKLTTLNSNTNAETTIDVCKNSMDGDYVKGALDNTINALSAVGVEIVGIEFTVDKLMIMSRFLDIADEEFNITGQDRRSIERLTRGISINLNHVDYYLEEGAETFAWNVKN